MLRWKQKSNVDAIRSAIEVYNEEKAHETLLFDLLRFPPLVRPQGNFEPWKGTVAFLQYMRTKKKIDVHIYNQPIDEKGNYTQHQIAQEIRQEKQLLLEKVQEKRKHVERIRAAVTYREITQECDEW